MVYKLYYFNARGVSEPIRQLFKLAGKDFEDIRFEHDTWPKYKPDTPFGQVPVLEVNGTKIAQSGAIIRYLAREFGYAGKTPVEQALVDSYFELYKDYTNESRNYFYIVRGYREGNAEEAHEKEYVPARDKFFGFIEKQLKANGTGFLVGDSVTFADLQLADHVAGILAFSAHELDNFPEAKKLREKVEHLPAIAQWLKDRPVTKN